MIFIILRDMTTIYTFFFRVIHHSFCDDFHQPGRYGYDIYSFFKQTSLFHVVVSCRDLRLYRIMQILDLVGRTSTCIWNQRSCCRPNKLCMEIVSGFQPWRATVGHLNEGCQCLVLFQLTSTTPSLKGMSMQFVTRVYIPSNQLYQLCISVLLPQANKNAPSIFIDRSDVLVSIEMRASRPQRFSVSHHLIMAWVMHALLEKAWSCIFIDQ